MEKQVILIVDDDPINLSVLSNLLKSLYTVRACKSGEDALRMVKIEPRPDLILLDIIMPGIDGYEVLSRLRKDSTMNNIPVIFISALDSFTDEKRGLELGAVDYIAKPFREVIVMARIKTHLELKYARDQLENQNHWLESEVSRRVKEAQMIQDAAMIALTQLVETRDENTGNHIIRTREYVEILARGLQKTPEYYHQLDEKTIARIVKAAPLHDIGKIGIVDAILLKPGKLTPEEFEVIKTHTLIGGDAIRNAINESFAINSGQTEKEKVASLLFLEEAERIARYHHERWDGQGYPYGLAGENIPISARLMMFADVFDALTTSRPYKEAWSLQRTTEYMMEQRGLFFDPDMVDTYLKEKRYFEKVLHMFADNHL